MSHNRSAQYGLALHQQSETTVGLSSARRRLVSVALPSPDGDTRAQRPLAANKAPTHGGRYRNPPWEPCGEPVGTAGSSHSADHGRGAQWRGTDRLEIPWFWGSGGTLVWHRCR